MTWIVVKKQNLFDIRIEREQDRAAQRTMPPPDMSLIFFVGILRV
jgi:hypothetical protein